MSKKKLGGFFIAAEKEKARDARVNENFYYESIHDLLQQPTGFPNLKTRLNYFKAKIVRIHSRRAQTLQLDTRETTILSPEELPPFYHLLQMQKRRRRLIKIMDQTGTIHTTHGKIVHTFFTSLRDGYNHNPVDRHCVEKLHTTVEPTIPAEWKDVLEAPITETELWQAIQ
jgi:hypothetical protein